MTENALEESYVKFHKKGLQVETKKWSLIRKKAYVNTEANDAGTWPVNCLYIPFRQFFIKKTLLVIKNDRPLRVYEDPYGMPETCVKEIWIPRSIFSEALRLWKTKKRLESLLIRYIKF